MTIANTPAGAARFPMPCDTLVSAGTWQYCFHTEGVRPATTYSAVRSNDGVRWTSWPLTFVGLQGQLEVQYFGHLGNQWYLQDYAQGLFSSTDGHTFTPVDPEATNGQLNGSETAVATFMGQPAMYLANSANLPAVVPDGAAAIPAAGLGAETDMYVPTPAGSLFALGRTPLTEANLSSPLSVASCDPTGNCPSAVALDPHMKSVLASAPAGAPSVLLLGDADARAVYVVTGGALHKSATLTRLVSSLQPGARLTQFQMGWAARSPSEWLIRLVFDPDPNVNSPPVAADLLIEGNPVTDRWVVRAHAGSDYLAKYRRTAGFTEPWVSSTCWQPLGAAITVTARGWLVAQACVATTGRLYVSKNDGRSWSLILS